MPEQDVRSRQPRFSTVTCPNCGHKSREEMPNDACVYFYECRGCRVQLKPDGSAPSDSCACIYCLYGDVDCPPVLAGEKGGC